MTRNDASRVIFISVDASFAVVFAALQAVELRPPVVENGDAGAERRDGGKVQVGGDDLLFPAALG